MKYSIGDIFIWKFNDERIELSTLINIYHDWNGEKKYIFESYIDKPVEQYIRVSYKKEELDKFIRTRILEHIPIIKD